MRLFVFFTILLLVASLLTNCASIDHAYVWKNPQDFSATGDVAQ